MQKLAIFVVLLLGAAFFAKESFRPIYRLRSNMPPQFVDASDSSQAVNRAAEEKLARAYWECAVTEIQWRYGYGYRLPQDPPVDFTVDSPDFGADSGDSATRARYWLRLQKVWYVPDNWSKSYQWDTRWMTDWTDSILRLAHGT